jgi:hypothetical protein
MSYHKSFIANLQRQGRWLVTGSPSTIVLTKKFGKKSPKVISVTIEKERDNMYVIAPIDYAFRSTVSHFDYVGEEHRWARNKTFLKSLIHSLKQAKIWELIKNNDSFISVNAHNPKSNKTAVRNQLKTIID